ncbi:heavy metal translocating P-type ATPase [Cellulomonas sp. S1-8]|uniref:heavy metal translocating P-type ATPase n=1 Tax=Cellulomonas sp. S1-8 TaxID=2904790 RepID=UPI0022446496|nr:cation-translocating P-type ATPase [Cellulomonas sp. S1-8]UZN04102.1 cation-translocating P-type ATPase [Cellulomonas sp. S1-8]
MTTPRRRPDRRWTVPAVGGLLVLAALVTRGAPPWSDLLMVAAAVVAGAGTVRRAARALAARVVGIDLLVAVAATGAVVIGDYWEAAAVTLLFALGHTLTDATLHRTRAALADLVAAAPRTAVVVRDGAQVEVPADEVVVGETVVVRDGTAVPVDGVVTGGTGAVDEASVTGESIPVEKVVDDRVFAGTVSHGGMLRVRVTGVGQDTTLARIVHRVEEAQDARARAAAFMDRFSAWYTPAIIALSVVAGAATGDVALALTLLVIGCPGALVISVPVAIVAGIGRGARDGVLVKGGEHLETVARVSAVAFDKTGTLTAGRPRVTDVVPTDGVDRDTVLRWAARAELGSGHPLAEAVVAAASAVPDLTPADEVQPVVGRGLVARADGRRILVGTLALLEQHGVATTAVDGAVTALASAGRTPVVVALDDDVLGVIGVADPVRPEAAEAVARLRRAGVREIVMLTGDQQRVADAVGALVGVTTVRAGLLPEDKLDAVRDLQARGHVVAMIGDGVNDAPALAAADVGVAMGAAGSAVAVETADVALMAEDLLRLPHALGLARRTVRVMRQNVAVALVTVAALLAGVLLGGVTMAVGMLVHEASVLVVIANAMRLLRRAPQPAGRVR